MKRAFILAVIVLVLAGLVFSAAAGAQMRVPASEGTLEREKASDNSSIVELEGDSLVLSPPGLEKTVFIHRKKDFPARPHRRGRNNPKKTCEHYGLIGPNWRTLPVNLVINPDNPDGLPDSFVFDAVTAGAEAWDTSTSADIYGSYTEDHEATFDEHSWQTDRRNEIVFAADDPGIIAVTIIWGYFTGSWKSGGIVECDIRLNTYYDWGDGSSDANVMDVQNIAIHELGHVFGLGDLYNAGCFECLEQTMYGYSDYRETKKRTLELGDVTGIRKLY